MYVCVGGGEVLACPLLRQTACFNTSGNIDNNTTDWAEKFEIKSLYLLSCI